MKPGGSISIWFFIGISLLVNGLLILALAFSSTCSLQWKKLSFSTSTPASGGALFWLSLVRSIPISTCPVVRKLEFQAGRQEKSSVRPDRLGLLSQAVSKNIMG